MNKSPSELNKPSLPWLYARMSQNDGENMYKVRSLDKFLQTIRDDEFHITPHSMNYMRSWDYSPGKQSDRVVQHMNDFHTRLRKSLYERDEAMDRYTIGHTKFRENCNCGRPGHVWWRITVDVPWTYNPDILQKQFDSRLSATDALNVFNDNADHRNSLLQHKLSYVTGGYEDPDFYEYYVNMYIPKNCLLVEEEEEEERVETINKSSV